MQSWRSFKTCDKLLHPVAVVHRQAGHLPHLCAAIHAHGVRISLAHKEPDHLQTACTVLTDNQRLTLARNLDEALRELAERNAEGALRSSGLIFPRLTHIYQQRVAAGRPQTGIRLARTDLFFLLCHCALPYI